MYKKNYKFIINITKLTVISYYIHCVNCEVLGLFHHVMQKVQKQAYLITIILLVIVTTAAYIEATYITSDLEFNQHESHINTALPLYQTIGLNNVLKNYSLYYLNSKK